MCLSTRDDGVASWYVGVADVRALYACPKELCLGIKLRDGAVLRTTASPSAGEHRSESTSSSMASTSGSGSGGRHFCAIPVDVALFFPHINVLHHVQEVVKTIAGCLTGMTLPVYTSASVSDLTKELILRPDGCRVKQPKMKLSQKSSRAVWATPDLCVPPLQETPLKEARGVGQGEEEAEPWYECHAGQQIGGGGDPSAPTFKRRRVFKRRLPQRASPGRANEPSTVEDSRYRRSSLFGPTSSMSEKEPHSHSHLIRGGGVRDPGGAEDDAPALYRSPEGSWLVPPSSSAPSPSPSSAAASGPPTAVGRAAEVQQRQEQPVHRSGRHRHHRHRRTPCDDNPRQAQGKSQDSGHRREREKVDHQRRKESRRYADSDRMAAPRDTNTPTVRKAKNSTTAPRGPARLPPRSSRRHRDDGDTRLDDLDGRGDEPEEDLNGPLFSPLTPSGRGGEGIGGSPSIMWADKMLQQHQEKQWCMVSCSTDSSVISVLSSSFRGSV